MSRALLLCLLGVALTPASAAADVEPGSLLIYYGWPSSINGTFSVALAAAELGRYDVIVLGDGLSKDTHPDHASRAGSAPVLTSSCGTAAMRPGSPSPAACTSLCSRVLGGARSRKWRCCGRRGRWLLLGRGFLNVWAIASMAPPTGDDFPWPSSASDAT